MPTLVNPYVLTILKSEEKMSDGVSSTCKLPVEGPMPSEQLGADFEAFSLLGVSAQLVPPPHWETDGLWADT